MHAYWIVYECANGQADKGGASFARSQADAEMWAQRAVDCEPCWTAVLSVKDMGEHMGDFCHLSDGDAAS